MGFIYNFKLSINAYNSGLQTARNIDAAAEYNISPFISIQLITKLLKSKFIW